MTRSISSGGPGTGPGSRDDVRARVDRLRGSAETVTPAEAGERVRELMRLAASGGGGEALALAVRFSRVSDCSTAELLRLWAAADGDPLGLCKDLSAPAYCARTAVRKLVKLSESGVGSDALELAARFIPMDGYASKFLVRLWREARDPDGFAEHLLAPAFRQEGRTELRLPYATSLRGLRHLTMLETLRLEQCGKVTDLTEVGELGSLRNLGLVGCEGVVDLTPLGRLSHLTRLDLSSCGAVEDFGPILNLSRLRQLSLNWTKVRSLQGFGRAFPDLDSLDLRFCPSLTSLDGLGELPSLVHLQVSGPAGLRDLSPFAALPRLRSLDLHDSGALTTLDGLGNHPRLRRLGIHGSPALRTTEGLGELPALREVTLTGCTALTDLKGLGRLPALDRLMINGSAVRDFRDLSGSPLRTLTLLYMKDLTSLGDLRDCPGLAALELRDCPLVEHLPLKQVSALSLYGARWADTSLLTGLSGLRTLEFSMSELGDIAPLAALPHLAELDLRHCRSVQNAGSLLDMPSLAHAHLAQAAWSTPSGAPVTAVTELRERGVTVTLHH